MDQPYGEGACRFLDGHPDIRESHPRTYVKFRPAGIEGSFLALLDTGAHYCILNTMVADLVRDELSESLGVFSVETDRGRMQGELYRHTITLIAEEGESLDIDAVVFIPPGWNGPCFLGYAGAMEYARFAVNPRTNRFQFGRP